MLHFFTAAESLFVSAHRDNQRLQMMALSGATPLKLGVDVAGILSSVPGLCSSVLMGNQSHIIFAQLGGPKLVRSFVRTDISFIRSDGRPKPRSFVRSFVRERSFVYVRSDCRIITLLHVCCGRSGGQARGRSTTSTPTNYTSVVTVARAGSAPRAGKKRHHRSDRAGGITAVRTNLRLALAARNKELRVERARSDTLAAQHATISNELKRVQESSDEARRANNARLQAVSNAGTASLFDGLQKREERHALELKIVKEQAELAASQHRAQLARAQAEVARVRKERDRARTDAALYYRERQLARAEVVELRVALSTAVVQQALRPEFPGSPEHE